MKRMKTFFIYFLLLLGLYIVSNLLQNGLILNMYSAIEGNAESNNQLEINVLNAKATNVNGYMNLSITNNSNDYVEQAYAKVDFIDKYNLNAITQYAIINDLEPGQTNNYKINFRGNKINEYNISFVSELPDKTHILNILGWEIDTTNVFGLGIDLTNVNGVDVTQYFSWNGAKQLVKDSWTLGVSFAKSIPLWGYVVASLIVVWYL